MHGPSLSVSGEYIAPRLTMSIVSYKHSTSQLFYFPLKYTSGFLSQYFTSFYYLSIYTSLLQSSQTKTDLAKYSGHLREQMSEHNRDYICVQDKSLSHFPHICISCVRKFLFRYKDSTFKILNSLMYLKILKQKN